MKILFVTDTWSENDHITNGIITWIRNMQRELQASGHDVTIVDPSMFSSFGTPTYKEVRVSVFSSKKIKKIIRDGNFDIIHLVTEGSLGLAAKKICDRNGIA